MSAELSVQRELLESLALECFMAREKIPNDKGSCAAPVIASEFAPASVAIFHQGDCLDFMKSMPDESVHLTVTSPPYNLGKKYERRGDFEKHIA